MRRALAFVVAVAPALALADDPSRLPSPPTIPTELPAQPSSPYVLSGVRNWEVNVGIGGSLDVNARTDAPNDTRTGRLSFVNGVDVGHPFWNQRIRPSLFGGMQLGYYGDDVHGWLSFLLGARLRVSMYMGDVWDFYGVAKTDFAFSTMGGSPVLRPGIGIGMRLGRVLSVEGTFDVLVALGDPFKNTQWDRFVPLGATLGVLFDTCFACNRADPEIVDRDVACRLYKAAKVVSTCAVSRSICAAVPRAMASCPNPLAATRTEDGTSTFLKALENETSDDAKVAVRRLVDLHAALLAQWADYEKHASAAGRDKRKLAERWSYAPVPAEIRTYLGCDGTPPPDCDEVPPKKK